MFQASNLPEDRGIVDKRGVTQERKENGVPSGGIRRKHRALFIYAMKYIFEWLVLVPIPLRDY